MQKNRIIMVHICSQAQVWRISMLHMGHTWVATDLYFRRMDSIFLLFYYTGGQQHCSTAGQITKYQFNLNFLPSSSWFPCQSPFLKEIKLLSACCEWAQDPSYQIAERIIAQRRTPEAENCKVFSTALCVELYLWHGSYYSRAEKMQQQSEKDKKVVLVTVKAIFPIPSKLLWLIWDVIFSNTA